MSVVCFKMLVFYSAKWHFLFCTKKKIIDDNIMDCKLLKNNNCQLFHIKYKIQILSMPLWYVLWIWNSLLLCLHCCYHSEILLVRNKLQEANPWNYATAGDGKDQTIWYLAEKIGLLLGTLLSILNWDECHPNY